MAGSSLLTTGSVQELLRERLAASQCRHELTRVDRENRAKTGQDILKLAVQDIPLIKRVLSSEEPPEALTKATHLMDAYKLFLQITREERKVPRPWENAPDTQVCRFNTACAV